jgi:hypothetical protein
LPATRVCPARIKNLCGTKLSKRVNEEKQGFVLEIGGRPVLALVGHGIEQARALCSETWFLEELGCYRSCGSPIWDGEATLCLRFASLRETAELEVALRSERARGEFEGYVFVFLVPVDPALQ